MSELGDQQLLERQADRGFRSRQRHDDASGDRSGDGAAHDRSRPNLLVAEHAKELAEALEPLPQHAVDRLERAIARRDAGAAGCDDDLDVRVGQLPADGIPQLFGVVPDERPSDDLMTGGAQELDDRTAARVCCLSARVADRDDVAADARRRRGFVFEIRPRRHAASLYRAGYAILARLRGYSSVG